MKATSFSIVLLVLIWSAGCGTTWLVTPTNARTDSFTTQTTTFTGAPRDSGSGMQVAPNTPAPRYVHQMMTYDEGNKCVLLLGGAGQSGSYGDLWAFDRHGWRKLSETGPTPREAGVLVYDTHRKRTVLYGGRNRNGPLLERWGWDGMH